MVAGAEAPAETANSERALQAVLVHHLKGAPPWFDVLCEPSIDLGDGTAIPDIVLIDRHETVVAVIELKFVPHAYPVFEDDLRKLRRFAGFKGEFPLTLEPSTGRFSERRYRFGPECLLVFAAIGQCDSKAVDSKLLSEVAGLGPRFVALAHAVGGGAQPAVAPSDGSAEAS